MGVLHGWHGLLAVGSFFPLTAVGEIQKQEGGKRSVTSFVLWHF